MVQYINSHDLRYMKRILHVPFKSAKRSLISRSFFTFTKMPPCYKQREIQAEIRLTAVEAKIRNLLVEYCQAYNAENLTPGDEIVLRVTGGWVRDKLLGDESNDLDIAINHLSGEAFTTGLMEYIAKNKADDTELITHSIHKIEKNPEKSKHLETCTTKLYGLDIDFVNLRNEEYTEDSRIPKISYGTPSEDAFRRDATLNSLFYNLTTQKVEDFTGLGLKDLSQGILRTPLPPKKTFLDDPLRCLRLIRFAARFGFEIESTALTLMQDQAIRDALMKKISRERVGVEIHKILQGPLPEYGFELIYETKLFNSIFNFGDISDTVKELNPSRQDGIDLIFDKSQSDLGQFNTLLRSAAKSLESSLLNIKLDELVTDKQSKSMLYLALILQRWEGVKLIVNTKKFKNESFGTDLIIKEGLKFSLKEAETVSLLVNTSDEFKKGMKQALNPDAYKRSDLGLLMRKYGDKWDLVFLFNLIKALFNSSSNGAFEIVDHYMKFYNLIKLVNLENVSQLKPIIDGKSLLKELALKPGPWMKSVNDEILIWQLEHPKGTLEECLKFVKEILPNYL